LQLCGWLFCLFVCFEDEIVYKCQNKIWFERNYV
jgi:hypothetical protein